MALRKIVTYSNKESNPIRRLTIQVILPPEFTDFLKDAILLENKDKYYDRLQFIFCEHVEDMVTWKQHHEVPPDYIFIVLDPRTSTCLQLAEDNINKIDPIYVNASRLCIVNGSSNTKQEKMGVALGHINIFCQKYSIMLINGDVLIPEKCRNLASRMCILATSVCGYNTGVPINLDIPGYPGESYLN